MINLISFYLIGMRSLGWMDWPLQSFWMEQLSMELGFKAEWMAGMLWKLVQWKSLWTLKIKELLIPLFWSLTMREK